MSDNHWTRTTAWPNLRVEGQPIEWIESNLADGYFKASLWAAESQGVLPIAKVVAMALRLHDEPAHSAVVEVEQTGGFTMVGALYIPDLHGDDWALVFNAESAALYTKDAWENGDEVEVEYEVKTPVDIAATVFRAFVNLTDLVEMHRKEKGDVPEG